MQEKQQADIDANFKATVMRAVAPLEETPEKVEPTVDDQNKTFRTRFIMVSPSTILSTSADQVGPSASCGKFWLLSNAILAIVISRLGTQARSYYFQAVLWITFGLSAVRFLGLLYYMFGEIGEWFVWGRATGA